MSKETATSGRALITATRSAGTAMLRPVVRALRRNYYLARAHYQYRLAQTDRKFDKLPLLVYQMGKVGSSTVAHTLKTVDLGRNVYHVHFLTPELIDEYEQKRKRHFGTGAEKGLKHIWQYQYLRKHLEATKKTDKCKIVSLVRDPVARNLAAFFEHIEVLTSSATDRVLRSREYDFEVTINDDDLRPLIDLFFEKCRHDTPLIYFDREFNNLFHVDVFATEFPSDIGYKIYCGDTVDILIIRLEDLNRCAPRAFEDFLGIENLELVNRNIGKEKDYADIYQMFKHSIRLPESYLTRIYESKFARHFYTQAEISRFTSRWTVGPD